tara:strand:- start:331 stop:1656 length:1326 start_codon:yes stop_codon:yes gene_type:complete
MKYDDLKKSKSFCIIPWVHLQFEPHNKVIPCCLTSPYNYNLGDLSKDSIKDIWNSEKQKKLRLQMLSGERSKICTRCWNMEDRGMTSNRQHNNKSYKSVMKEVEHITLPDGTVPEMRLKYWDMRFSNICNLKCRSCGPKHSSSWVPDAIRIWGKKRYGQNKKGLNVVQEVDGQSKLAFLEDQIQHVERIYFAGGEPMMMDDHWYILELLKKHKRFDVRIMYNTNTTKLEHKGKSVLDYWKLWEPGKIEIWPSLDEFGERAELVRSGTVWSKVEKNIKTLIGLNKSIHIQPGITVGALNVFRLPAIIDHFIKMGLVHDNYAVTTNTWKVKYNNWFLNFVHWPEDQHVTILSDKFKKEILQKYKFWIEDYKEKYQYDPTPKLKEIMHGLTLPHNPAYARLFLNKHAKLDKIRKESVFAVIPELEDVRKMYPGIYEEAYEKFER